MDPTKPAAIGVQVAAELGWEVKESDIQVKDMHPRRPASKVKTFRVAATGKKPVALHIRSAQCADSITQQRLDAVALVFSDSGLTPCRLAKGSTSSGHYWYIEEWGGTTLACPWQGLVEGAAASTPTELGALLAKVHSIESRWFELFRAEYSKRIPALLAASSTNLVWLFHNNRGLGGPNNRLLFGPNRPQQDLPDCRANIAGLSEVLDALHLSEEQVAEWVACGETRVQWRSPVASRLVTAHGDFHMQNIVRGDDGLKVIDLEFAGVLPAGWDLTYAFWSYGSRELCTDFVRGYLAALGEDSSITAVEEFILDALAVLRGGDMLFKDLVGTGGAKCPGAPRLEALAWIVHPANLTEELRQEMLETCGDMSADPLGREVDKLIAGGQEP